jgi:hypothetical protein
MVQATQLVNKHWKRTKTWNFEAYGILEEIPLIVGNSQGDTHSQLTHSSARGGRIAKHTHWTL